MNIAAAKFASRCNHFRQITLYLNTQAAKTALDNLALACEGCNAHKHTKTQAIDPVSGEPAPLFNPRRQHWQEHFMWNANFTLIVGLTPSGRATVEALHMNRESVVNLRRALHKIGEHPPE